MFDIRRDRETRFKGVLVSPAFLAGPRQEEIQGFVGAVDLAHRLARALDDADWNSKIVLVHEGLPRRRISVASSNARICYRLQRKCRSQPHWSFRRNLARQMQ